MHYMPKNPSPTSGFPLQIVQPRAWLYARVSKDHRDGRSVSQQLDIGRRKCEEHRIPIAGEYTDNDKSASQYATRVREDWERLMADLDREARPGDRLWAWEISRWTREREIWAQLVKTCQRKGVLLWLGDSLYDPNDSTHMFVLDMLIANAVKEVGGIRERILRDMEAAAKAGRPSGRPGYGYRHVHDPDTGALVARVPDPEQSLVVSEIAEMYLGQGMSAAAIARTLNERRVPGPSGQIAGELDEDGRPVDGWLGMTVSRILRRPEIMGRRTHHGEIIRAGGWEGIVPEADWWRIQERLDQAAKTYGSDARSRWLLSGIAICDVCEGPLYVGTTTGSKRHKPLRAYRCQGLYAGASYGHVSRKAEVLEFHFQHALFRHFSRPDALEAFQADVVTTEELEARQARAHEIERERRQLYDKVAQGAISLELAEAYERRLNAERAALGGGDDRPHVLNWHAAALAADSPEEVEATWRSWELEQKRAAVRAVVEELRVPQVGKVGRRKLRADEVMRLRFKGQ